MEHAGFQIAVIKAKCIFINTGNTKKDLCVVSSVYTEAFGDFKLFFKG